MRKLILPFLFLTTLIACSSQTTPANTSAISENAPADRIDTVAGKDAVKNVEAMIAPAIAEARKTLPEAKKRFFDGLKKGESFYLTINLREGNVAERVFMRVVKWEGETITGTISNDLQGLKTYKNGQTVTFLESDVLDWTFSEPDGTEDGNYIGKLMDAQH